MHLLTLDLSASPAQIATWLITAAVVLGIIVRPWGLPEALWATLGAAALPLFSLLPAADVCSAVRNGSNVYWFLAGMMLLAELARRHGLFRWLAAYAVIRARGSAVRLFTLIYAVGILVTMFLSNDATAVVLTPAVYAATRAAGARPMPHLYICAFIANAASFVLPISNPANLVVYGRHLPALGAWLSQFGAASAGSILATYLVLRFTQRAGLLGPIACDIELPPLPPAGRIAAGGIAVTAVVLLAASALDRPLGFPTLLAAAATWAAILCLQPESPWRVLRSISWSILPLVAGLFVLVRGIEQTGILAPLARLLRASGAASPHAGAMLAAGGAALASNAVNNLPLGLVAGSVAQGAHLSAQITGALLLGVDLGPNLSVTGSLATILWLLALRREGLKVSAWRFLLLGAIVMPPALIAALAALLAR